MARHDWYRRTTWTQRDQNEFLARNKRSRGADSKAQYLRIQAQTLLETGNPVLIGSALDLVQKACSEYPHALDSALAFETAGRCCEALGRADEAIRFYRQALQREREFPGIRTNAAFRLAKVAIENERRDLYSEAVDAAAAHGEPIFPWNAYFLYGARAVIARDRGDHAEAKSLATTALQASAVGDTGLSHGRGHLGTVKSPPARFHAILRRIADA